MPRRAPPAARPEAVSRKPRDRAPGGLSPEDLDLWRRVTQDLRPLAKRAADARSGPVSPPSVPSPSVSPPATAARRASRPARPAPPGATDSGAPAAPPELAPGLSAGLDRRSALRLRRGQYPIDATLDLHGLTQAAAARALARFLSDAQAAGRRCVLVVTGKGATSAGGGVLRREVPRWLNQAPNRARVLGFDHALPRDGGQGALYVLLRRADKGPTRG